LPLTSSRDEIVFQINDKPAAIVSKLEGQSELSPNTKHCELVGSMLAQMHLAGKDFLFEQPNLRGLRWWNETTPLVLPHINERQQEFLKSELAFQNHIATLSAYAALPVGPVHADLFRDNVMFKDSELTGFFDFYFAGIDHWVYDLAICLNDWCIDHDSGQWHKELFHAFLMPTKRYGLLKIVSAKC
jgi:homoserine kinase type II